MTVDTSQNVGIGASTLATKFTVNAGASGGQIIYGTSFPYIALSDVYNNTPSYIRYDVANNNMQFVCAGGANTGYMTFATGNGNERMRIDSSGNLLVGTTVVVNTGKVISGFNGSSSVGFVANDTASASAGVYYGCSLNGTFIGSIQRVGATSAVVYNTTSDQRLKSNIADANSVLSTLMNVKVRQYDWTDGDLHQDYGFIAQELESVLSGVVTKGKTEEDMWQLDYSRLTPHLVKAIQELSAKNDSLEARLAALEAK